LKETNFGLSVIMNSDVALQKFPSSSGHKTASSGKGLFGAGGGLPFGGKGKGPVFGNPPKTGGGNPKIGGGGGGGGGGW
jgi:hypothetical protein